MVPNLLSSNNLFSYLVVGEMVTNFHPVLFTCFGVILSNKNPFIDPKFRIYYICIVGGQSSSGFS